MLAAVAAARKVAPRYGRGAPARAREVERLATSCALEVHVSLLDMDAPAVLLPPIAGRRHLVLSSQLSPPLRRYVTLHEIGHVLAGDADDVIFLSHRSPLPEAEEVADLFALLGTLSRADFQQAPEGLEACILARVPLDDHGWRSHRVPRLARKLWRLTAGPGGGVPGWRDGSGH